MKNFYIVSNKPDDYGNCREELVETTPENADQYYVQRSVPQHDIETLKRHMTFIPYEEENERTEEERFYGN